METQTYHVDVRRHVDGTFHNITRAQSLADATHTAAMLNIFDRGGGEYFVREYTGRPDGCHCPERQIPECECSRCVCPVKNTGSHVSDCHGGDVCPIHTEAQS